MTVDKKGKDKRTEVAGRQTVSIRADGAVSQIRIRTQY
jgi:hypothetical protein